YARIGNGGNSDAKNLVIHFEVASASETRGDCVPGPNQIPICLQNFVLIGTADATAFPPLASLAPGAQATVFVPYTAPAQNGRPFAPTAMRVRIETVSNEISPGNNTATSAFDRVQVLLQDTP